MIIVRHRINDVEQLRLVPKEYGVEIDIRSNNNELILHHDPFEIGESLEKWLNDFEHEFIILNVKEEGLEEKILNLMIKYKITKFFFLDQSFPFLIKTAKTKEKRCAVRISEYEDIKTALSLQGMIEWIWVDCFTKFPLNLDQVNELRVKKFKLCLVSPELQGELELSNITKYINALKFKNIKFDAVCTKYPKLWAQ